MTPISYLYPVLNRAAFQKATGKQSPPFDASKPPKRWAATDGATSFTVLGDGPDGTSTLTLDAEAAAAVNLPGPYSYDATLYPGVLIDSDIQEIAQLIGGAVDVAHAVGTGPAASNLTWPVIKFKDAATQVPYTEHAGLIVMRWYQIGRNRVGKWRMQSGQLVLDPAPEQPVAGVTPPEVPLPIVPLKPGQKIVRPGITGAPLIQDPSDVTSPAGGSFTDSDRALLFAILQAVSGGGR